ncbi:MAG: hypothetical protein M0R38_12460 [Bacteroidia bacterium]|nr:hypothetical protein [Bacteroidia bacterium]
MKKEHLFWLETNEACQESMDWIAENNIQSLEEAWNACERGEWLLWLAQELRINKRKLVMCGALCAHTVVEYMEDSRSRNAVRIAFLWGRGKATDAPLKAAREARAASYDATAERNAERNAAWAATWAVEGNPERAAAWAGKAGDISTEKKTANIARELLTEEVMNAIRAIDFVCHGTYTISNACGYEIQISNDGEAARIRDNGKITDWLPIQFCYDEEEQTVGIIDPEGYNINLDGVLKI